MTIQTVGDNIEAKNANWSFSGDTANSFAKHVRRSVPMYEEGHHIIEALSDFFVKDNSTCYELGSSVGELTKKLASRHENKGGLTFVGIDEVEEMTAKANELNSHKSVQYITADINQYDLKKSDLIVANYTIQFIEPRLRQDLFNKIYESLNWGGALILFEKVRAPDARFQDIISSLYMDFKLENNYSPSEIIAKSRSLKGVLEPFSTQANQDMMKRAGFVDITSVMKYLCFEGFLAIK